MITAEEAIDQSLIPYLEPVHPPAQVQDDVSNSLGERAMGRTVTSLFLAIGGGAVSTLVAGAGDVLANWHVPSEKYDSVFVAGMLASAGVANVFLGPKITQWLFEKPVED